MRRATALAAVLALSACASFQARNSAAPFAPLPPASLGRTVQAEQILRIAFGENAVTLQCAVSVTPAEITQSCFTALGQRVLHLKHDGRALSADAEGLPIAPDRVLSDLQLAYWPLPALKAALAGPGWELSEPAPGLRRLRRDGALYAEVHYSGHYAGNTPWNGRLWLVNFEQRYALDIESRENKN